MYSLFHTKRYKKYGLGYVQRSKPSEFARLAELALLKSKFIHIYRRSFESKSLTHQEHELASRLYAMIKERTKSTDCYIDIIWSEIQMWYQATETHKEVAE